MMNEIRLLTALELRDLYGFNRFRHTKDKKARRNYLLLGGVWLLLIAMIAFYVGLLVYGLHFIRLSRIVPAYLMVIASLLVFAFGLFKAGGTLFRRNGYDMLCALPVRTSSIVISRFLSMYVQDLALTYLVTLPGMLVYGWLLKPDWAFYAQALFGSLFIPALPLAAATALGALVTAVSSRMKHQSMMQTIGTLLVVLLIIAASSGLGWVVEDITPMMLFRLADTAAMILGRLYPPANWFCSGWLNLAWLALLSTGCALGMLWLVSKFFHQICHALFANSAAHDYRMEKLQSRSVLMALYCREVKRYFASTIYVTNTIIGPIMGMGLCIALYFAGVETVFDFLPAKATALVPFAVAAVFTMMNTTSVSISMEGKHVWILQTLPVPAQTLWNAKMLLNLSLIVPFFLVGEVFLMLSLKPSLMEAVWLALIPTSIILFSVVSGIAANLKTHRFDWEKEETIVKQSASASIGGFAGLLCSLVFGAITFFLPGTQMISCAAILLLTWLLYQSNNRAQLQNL